MGSTKEQSQAKYHTPRRQDSAIRGNVKIFRDGYQKHKGIFRRQFSIKRIYNWVGLRMLLYLSIGGASAQLKQMYCSSQNTGADHYIGKDDWQTLGLCKDSCNDGGYAFGVVKGYECWCSDYAPNPSNSRSDCVTCPQYDAEKCGNAKTGTYGYIDTGTEPKGTAEASDNPASSTSSSRTEPSSSPSSSVTYTAPYISVITVDGPPKTVIITPSGYNPSASSTPTSSADSGDTDFFDNAGRVAGVFTVLALLIIALIFALFWYMRRRKQRGSPLSAESPTPESFGAGGMLIGATAHEKRRSRSVSTLGLTAPYSDRPHPPPQIVSNNSGSSGGSGIPTATPDRITDQRLDPGQVWMRFENDNASRMSVRSLRDDQDYSRRVLRIANPDDD